MGVTFVPTKTLKDFTVYMNGHIITVHICILDT